MTGGNPSKRKHQHQISSEEVTIKHTKHDRWKIANFVMISTTATQTQSLPTAELLDVLECPVCKILPRTTPIYQCENGHIYCNECKPNLRTCAVCRVTLGDIRSLICEQVIEYFLLCKLRDWVTIWLNYQENSGDLLADVKVELNEGNSICDDFGVGDMEQENDPDCDDEDYEPVIKKRGRKPKKKLGPKADHLPQEELGHPAKGTYI